MSDLEYKFTLSTDAEKYAEEFLHETRENRADSIRQIKKWLEDNPDINANTEDAIILAFLRGSKFNLNRAKEKITNYYSMRKSTPEWFNGRDPLTPKVQELINLGIFIPLTKFYQNRLVIIIRTAAHNPKHHTQDEVFKVGKMILDVATREFESVQIYGITAVFDMNNVTTSHAKQLSPAMIKKMVYAWQNYHCRPKQLEFINAPIHVNLVLNIFKSFMTDKLKSRTKIHTSGLKALHKIVDKSVLPVEYGGDTGSLDELVAFWKDKVVQQRDWLLYDEQFKSKFDNDYLVK